MFWTNAILGVLLAASCVFLVWSVPYSVDGTNIFGGTDND